MLCKLCLEPPDEYISFKTSQEHFGGPHYAQIITKYFDIQLKRGNNIICLCCWLSIKTFHEFSERIIEKQKNLLNVCLSNRKVAPAPEASAGSAANEVFVKSEMIEEEFLEEHLAKGYVDSVLNPKVIETPEEFAAPVAQISSLTANPSEPSNQVIVKNEVMIEEEFLEKDPANDDVDSIKNRKNVPTSEEAAGPVATISSANVSGSSNEVLCKDEEMIEVKILEEDPANEHVYSLMHPKVVPTPEDSARPVRTISSLTANPSEPSNEVFCNNEVMNEEEFLEEDPASDDEDSLMICTSSDDDGDTKRYGYKQDMDDTQQTMTSPSNTLGVHMKDTFGTETEGKICSENEARLHDICINRGKFVKTRVLKSRTGALTKQNPSTPLNAPHINRNRTLPAKISGSKASLERALRRPLRLYPIEEKLPPPLVHRQNGNTQSAPINTTSSTTPIIGTQVTTVPDELRTHIRVIMSSEKVKRRFRKQVNGLWYSVRIKRNGVYRVIHCHPPGHQPTSTLQGQIK